MVGLLNLVLKVWHYAWLWLWRKWWITHALILRACKTGQKISLILCIPLILTLVMILGRQILKIESFLNTFNSLWGLNRLRSLRAHIITTLVSSTLSLHILVLDVWRFWYLKWSNSNGTRLITSEGRLLHVFSTLMSKLLIILIFCNSLLRLLRSHLVVTH